MRIPIPEFDRKITIEELTVKDAEKLGAKAYMDGQTKDDNPLPEGDLHDVWDKAFDDEKYYWETF